VARRTSRTVSARRRGLDSYDIHTVDLIVDGLDREDGRFSALLFGVIDSAPFQRRRAVPDPLPQPDPKP
jgi:hypothetical protein